MSRAISTIGVPMDPGRSRRGVDRGASALRDAGLRDRLRGHRHRAADLALEQLLSLLGTAIL